MAVARLTAVVVFPTPPFWLTMARMRGATTGVKAKSDIGHTLQPKYDPARVAEARDPVDPHVPALFGGSQLVLHALPLEQRSEEHTSELQSLMRISYAVLCLK